MDNCALEMLQIVVLNSDAVWLPGRVGKWPESDSPVSTLDGTFDLPNIRNIEVFLCPITCHVSCHFLALLPSMHPCM